jgi:hypothetical protein
MPNVNHLNLSLNALVARRLGQDETSALEYVRAALQQQVQVSKPASQHTIAVLGKSPPF